jgi:flagellar hook-associated protein 1
MYGPNVGLEIGKRALLAQQLSLNITGHNIANVNTPGFTRQQAILSSNQPLQLPFGNVGTGVDISGVRRLRSEFLDQQFRGETQKLGKWSLLNQTWKQVESVFSEPQDTALGAIIDQFWTSWQDLSNNPRSEAARIAVREQSSLMVNSFHHLSSQMGDLRASLDGDITKTTDQINSISTQIADLNQSVAAAELNGDQANDLRDRRDYLVDQLSEYVDVSTVEHPTGAVTVYLGSMALVEGNAHAELDTRVESNGSVITHTVFFKGTGVDLMHTGGKLEGMISTRDDIVTEKQKELDTLARELAGAVNGIHKGGKGAQGSTGISFFNPDTTGASDIELDSRILQDVNNIAAGQSGEPGDNSNALAIAALRSAPLLKSGQTTFNEYYNSVIGEIGIRSQEADSLEKNQQALVDQISNSRQSVGGVSLDEEMAKMIEYQHAYAAAAKVISTMDMALDTIINGLGVGSR